MRRVTRILAGVVVLVALASVASTVRADHPGTGFAVTPVGHHGGHHGAHFYGPPQFRPPVYGPYPVYRVVPPPYYPRYGAPYHPGYPGGVISYYGRHVGITLGF